MLYGATAASSSDFGESFILEVVALVIIVGIVWRYAVPPLRNMMNTKLESIRSQLAAGDEARASAEQLLAQRRAELESAKTEAKAIVEQAQHGAVQLIEDGRKRSADEYERIVAHAATQIDLEQNRMRQEIMTEMSSLVLRGAHQVVDAELDDSRHRVLIDVSIAAVESEIETEALA